MNRTPVRQAAIVGVLLFALALFDHGTSVTLVAQAPGPPAFAYTVTDLGTLGGSSATASSINESGQIAGSSELADGSQHAFVWTAGVMTDLGTFGFGGSAAAGINNAGQVIGNAKVSSGYDHAFLWTAGQMRDLGTLGGLFSYPYGLNNLGQVVGSSATASGTQAFLWQNGTMIGLGNLGGSCSPPCDQGTALAVNDAGQVAGSALTAAGFQHAFLLQNGSMTDLGTLSGGTSRAMAMNAVGQIVGIANGPTAPFNRPFIWQNGMMSPLETFGGFFEYANDINDGGTVVGSITTFTFQARAVMWANGAKTDLNGLVDPDAGWVLLGAASINNAGQIVGYGTHNGQPRAFLLNPAKRRPVLLIPGIAGTYAADVSDLGAWMFERGLHPDGLQIDPLAHAYDDVIATLKNVGYVEGKDLFVVKYDWRVPVGPSDGVFDGVVGGITAQSITDQNFDYAVDYLGYYLRQAKEAWAVDHPGTPLDKVDIIAHSTGGLVARTYIQSAAYGGALGADQSLPQVDKLIMIGVPNRGASKPWNTLHDNWGVDLSFQLVLSKMLNMGYQKVLAGATILGPDQDISVDSLVAPACQDAPEICFIRQYNPTARALLATYDFIDFGHGFTNLNANPYFRNNLVLDLNAGLDLSLTGDANAFADRAAVTVIYGTSVDTPTAVIERVGTVGGENAIVRFSDFATRDARPGEVWYDDIVASRSGDGTVPLDSSAGQFFGDSRVTLRPFTQGANTQQDVSHLGLMFNLDVQKEVLGVLGVPFADANISTARHEEFAPQMSTATNVAANIIGGSILGAILDPVEGFIVDGQGRRLGYTTATGAVTEIPGSMWFGNTDGLGWVMKPLVEPLSLQLSGLGGHAYTMVSVVNETGGGGRVDQGQLDAGDTRLLSIPTTPNQVPTFTPPANIAVTSDTSAGKAVTFIASGDDAEDGAIAATCTPASGSVFPIGATTVACTVTDSAGALASGSFTVTVTLQQASTPGEMAGEGVVRDDGARYQFSFHAVENGRGERAQLTVRIDDDGRKKDPRRPACVRPRDDRFVSKTVTSITFSDDPAIKHGRANHPQIDTVLFSGVGGWNGQRGYRYEAFAQDEDGPGRQHREAIRVTIWSPAGSVVAAFEGTLDGGNIRSCRIKH